MTPEKETELFAMLELLLTMGKTQGEQIKSLNDQLKIQGDQLKAQGERIHDLQLGQARQEAQLEGLGKQMVQLQVGQGRLEGELGIIVQWMNSMDQRFTALMSPYMPPRKPAA